jgi:hypothetical protein
MLLGNPGLVSQYWLQFHHDVDCANTAILDLVSTVYHTVRYLCLGFLDTPQFRHAGQLHAVGHY